MTRQAQNSCFRYFYTIIGSISLRGHRINETVINLVSAAGFEPATHALKGHCSTN